MRRLDPDEQALWERVTATIRPLSRQPPARQPPARQPLPAPAPAAAELRTAAPRSHAPQPRRSPVTPPRKPLPNSLDGSWDRRLREGRVEPDRVLDLHGHSLDSAWAAIDRGLEQAIARGERVVLLITGHHRPGEPPVARGRIRAAIHDWLAASRHSSAIAAVRGAHRRHGGGGSLYLILRRR